MTTRDEVAALKGNNDLLREEIGKLEFVVDANESALARLNRELTELRIEKAQLEEQVLKMAGHPAWQCSGCGTVKRFPRWELGKPCPTCERRHYWTGSVHPEALAKYEEERG